ncbi:MAG: elongation factor P [candidate division NC10 bacterium]|nr:elongation factor P [candidate division NC10 bacterium]
MISAGDLRTGMRIELDGVPYVVLGYQWVKPGKGGAFMRTKLRNMKTGTLLDKTFRTEEKVSPAQIEERKVQFLYKSEVESIFMDMETYEQFSLGPEELGPAKDFLEEGLTLTTFFHRGEAVGVELPIFVELAVAETDPGVRGDTAQGGSKPAKLETGAILQVPLFINVGDRIRVDTRTGDYVERV